MTVCRAAGFGGGREVRDLVRDRCFDHRVMEAVAGNTGAAAEVLVRLLAPEAEECWYRLVWRDLPEAVIDAILVHPNIEVRRRLAESGYVRAEQRARLIDDPEPRVRVILAFGPEVGRRGAQSLPEDIQRRLLTDPSARVRMAAGWSPWLAPHLREEFAVPAEPEPEIGIGPKDSVGTEEIKDSDINLELLSRDPDYVFRLLLHGDQSGIDPEVVLQTYLACDYVSAGDLLERRDFPKRGLARRFADHPDPKHRNLVSLDPDADPGILVRLVDDPDDWVRTCVIRHPNLPADVLLACHADPANRVAALGNPGLPTVLLHQALDGAGVPR